MRGAIISAMAIVLCVSSASAATITFNGLDQTGPFQGNGKAFTIYTESDFTVSAPNGQYVQGMYPNGENGGFNPSLLTGGFNGTTNAILTVSSGSLFYFYSFDMTRDGSRQSPASYSLAGYLGSTLLWSTPAVELLAGLNRFDSGGDMTQIDRLTLTTSSEDPLFVDNIVVTPAATVVPEPATWAMMVGGFALVGGAMRVRRRRAAMAV